MTARRRLLAVAAAVGVLAVDLAHEALTPTPFHHPRAPAALLLIAVLAVAVLATVPRAPSLVLSLAGGIAAGGALGNLASALVWRAGIPDPLVHGAYAFNLADVALVAGDATLLTTALVVAWDHRRRLREPI
ncbi:MAG TPA: signal peptidase II [Gaiellaceae bacterium]|nr:signal peptidase II [Gaiellaceae bacterium]